MQHILRVKNCDVDLRTGYATYCDNKMKDSEYMQMYSADIFASYIRCSNVHYKGIDFNTDYIEQYIESLVGKSQIEKFHRILSYMILKDKSECKTLHIYGNGCNGKDTFINLLKNVCGDSFIEIPDSSIYITNRNDIMFSKRVHARIAVCREINQNNSNELSYNKIARLASNTPIPYRDLYQVHDVNRVGIHANIITTGNVVISQLPDTNFNKRKPELKIIQIEFIKQLQGKYDPFYYDKIKKYSDQLLVWLVKGVMKYNKNIYYVVRIQRWFRSFYKYDVGTELVINI